MRSILGPEPSAGEVREVIFAHPSEVQPLSAVKNGLLQASLDQLKQGPHYARYLQHVDPSVPALIGAELALGWAPIELACAHYQACDDMMLGAEELAALGTKVGDRMQKSSLASSARAAPESRTDLWSVIGALHRMWGRHYQGGSVQVIKLGPHTMQLEQRAFVLNQFRYYRMAQLGAIRVTFAAVGVEVKSAKIASYSAGRHDLAMLVEWD